MSAQTTSQLEEVKAWLQAKKPELTQIDLELDLIENRIIDSLSFLEFLYFLEELAGRDLQAEAQSINSFRTLRVIRDNILNGASHG